MKTTLVQISQAFDSISGIDSKLDFDLLEKFDQLITEFDPFKDLYNQVKSNYLDQYVSRDENGNPKYTQQGNAIQFDIPPENKNDYNNKINQLNFEVVEVEIPQLKKDDLKSIKLTMPQYQDIKWLLSDSDNTSINQESITLEELKEKYKLKKIQPDNEN